MLRLLLLCFSAVVGAMSVWKQDPSPAGGYAWTLYDPFDPVLPLTQTRFHMTTLSTGDEIMPDTMTFLQWTTYPRTDSVSPTDVRIRLVVLDANDGMDVSVLAHSVPNAGSWLWMPRVPRGWSIDDYYVIRICSLYDDHECSDSNPFRFMNLYAFFP